MKKHIWFIVALVAVLAAAPHATVIRAWSDTADPYYLLLSRFGVAAIVILPFLLLQVKWRMLRKTWRYLAVSSLSMTTVGLLYTQAIYHSQASYVAILAMLTPIILVLVSARFFKEAITRRKVAGVALAMMGALVVVALPFVATQQLSNQFYPLATIMMIIQSVLFVAAFITMRKANEAGMPILGVTGITAVVGVIVLLPIWLLYGDMNKTPTDVSFIWAAIYYGVGVTVVFRAMAIKAYEYIGAMPSAALQYVESIVAVILPILIIGERLSVAMVVGGLMILLGVYFVESHKNPHIKRHAAHRHH